MSLDNTISQYYDCEMNDNDLIHFEANLALRNEMLEYTNKKCYEFFKISNSIKLVKMRAFDKSKEIFDIKNQKRKKLFININTVGFKSFYKHLRNGILNILRNNSK